MLLIILFGPRRSPTVGVSLQDRVSIGFQSSSIIARAPGHPASTDRVLGLARQNDRVKNLPPSELSSLPAAASLQGCVQILVKSGEYFGFGWRTCLTGQSQEALPASPITLDFGRVEDARGGVQGRRRLLRAASFVATLAEKSIAPSRVPAHRTGRDHFGHPALGRVSRAAFAAASRGSRSRARTPSSPNTAAAGNCRYPGPASLCRRRRKRRTE
jgi:hypothetical protein